MRRKWKVYMKTDDKLIIEQYRTITEARRDVNSPVAGIHEFLTTIKNVFQPRYSNIDEILTSVKSFIEQSKCPAIKFERITGALGISLTDICIVSDRALNSSLSYLLYIIFHEISHQYQYSKYGEKFVQDIYNDEMPLEDAARKLKRVEYVADRYAIMKVKRLYNEHIPDGKPAIRSFYKNISIAGFANQLRQIRKLARQQNLTDIDDINEMIYNMIKPQLTTADDILY